ncbi:lipopolysaccharide biosynthesis protein [Intestinibacter bartlettii]|uniref:lipopolysaccharide biosynthesis protein n=1 Tax=Intestinibacter bartlettii TaxID=261299 RepID=UPI0008218B90|nr:oligosaccharide flippase family protein [Intestinibacter bartlettii]SCI71424.1 Polysaccharide biosynthesis protein [uncultured Clostridium sp.]
MNDNSRVLNSVRNILTGFLGQFITLITGFVSRTVFIQCLATEYLGVSGLFTNILSVLSLAELGIGTAINYALYKPLAEKNEEEVSRYMNFYSKAYIVIGIVIFVIGIVLLPFLKYLIKDAPDIKENLNLIYLIYLTNTSIGYFFAYKISLINADQRNYIVAAINYVAVVLQAIVQIVVLLLTKNFLLYLMVQFIFSIAQNLVIHFTANKLYPFLKKNKELKLNKNKKMKLISDIRDLMINKLSGILVNNTDNLIITYFKGLSIVGICSNYNLLIGIINTVLLQFFNGVLASLGNLNAIETREKREKYFRIMNFANFWMFGFCTICIITLINDVITIWIGTEYLLPNSIKYVLAANFYIIGMQNSVWSYKVTSGIFKQGRFILAIMAMINLVLSIILGNRWGLFGVLFATTIARLCTNVWYDPYAVYKIAFKKSPKSYYFEYIKNIIIMLATLYVVNFITNRWITMDNIYINFIIKLLICIIIPNLCFLLTFYKKKEFCFIKNYIFNLMKSNNFIMSKVSKLNGLKSR